MMTRTVFFLFVLLLFGRFCVCAITLKTIWCGFWIFRNTPDHFYMIRQFKICWRSGWMWWLRARCRLHREKKKLKMKKASQTAILLLLKGAGTEDGIRQFYISVSATMLIRHVNYKKKKRKKYGNIKSKFQKLKVNGKCKAISVSADMNGKEQTYKMCGNISFS